MSASKTPKPPRKHRSYIPIFKGIIEGWTMNYLAANYWRVEQSMERRDCLQEAWLVFAKIAERYPDVEAPHFFALYRTAWTRRFDDLSTRDSRVRSHEIVRGRYADADREMTIGPEHIGELSNAGELLVALRQAPREVRMVLELVLRAPQEVVEMALAGRGERLCGLLGIAPGRDVLAEVRAYFG